jgi:hypothetical protein
LADGHVVFAARRNAPPPHPGSMIEAGASDRCASAIARVIASAATSGVK